VLGGLEAAATLTDYGVKFCDRFCRSSCPGMSNKKSEDHLKIGCADARAATGQNLIELPAEARQELASGDVAKALEIALPWIEASWERGDLSGEIEAFVKNCISRDCYALSFAAGRRPPRAAKSAS
jgi:hypothetical protein